MQITKLTPDEARAVSEMVARACGYFRAIVDQFRAMARDLIETVRHLGEYLRRLGITPAAAGPSRPAWVSPYGPPQRRRR
ncbi:hypothetical protein [Streptomyces sp. NPDC086782]|uniref:hypothetical protein n=1 Tax=Streptomyces sp. NPDC086782 TaxID=3365757 RepID=UPI003822D394